MNPVTAIEIAAQLIQFAMQLAPSIKADLAKGTVTAAQQEALAAAVAALNAHGFTGDQWRIGPDPVNVSVPAGSTVTVQTPPVSNASQKADAPAGP